MRTLYWRDFSKVGHMIKGLDHLTHEKLKALEMFSQDNRMLRGYRDNMYKFLMG